MTPELSNQKKTNMRLRFQQACEAHKARDYPLAAQRISQISEMSASYIGVDSELHLYGLRLTIAWAGFFIQDDTRDFNTWAVGQVCTGLRAAA